MERFEESRVGGDFTILVTDLNPRVRQFLKRELEAEGYLLAEAGDEEELWRTLRRNPLLDAVILDPEISVRGAWSLMTRLTVSHPRLPFLVHSFVKDYSAHPCLHGPRLFVEKAGDNIAELKAALAQVLRRRYPERIAAPVVG